MTESTTPQLAEDDVREIEVRANAATVTVTALNNGDVRWRLSVPARPDSDPDLVISASLADVPALIRDWRATRARIAQLEQEQREGETCENCDDPAGHGTSTLLRRLRTSYSNAAIMVSVIVTTTGVRRA